MAMRYVRLMIFLLVAVVSFLCTEPLNPVGAGVGEYNVKVEGFSATYNHRTGKVDCAWTPPVPQPSFYKLYRSADGSGNEMVSLGDRSRIPGTSSTYSDIVGLENADYYYELRAVFISRISSTFDTTWVEGPPSDRVLCHVGSGLAFSINDGALFTASNVCSLMVLDYYNLLSQAEFYGDSTLDSTRRGVLDLSDTARVKHFHHWVLPPGKNVKKVWARLVFAVGDSSVVLTDDIGIRPYRVEAKMRNEFLLPNETARAWYVRDGQGEYVPGAGRCDRYVLYRPKVEFGLSIFGDSTFDTVFSYWLVFPRRDAYFADNQVRWLTKPRQAVLRGVGPAHDDLWKYTYAFDSVGEESRENLSRLTLVNMIRDSIVAQLRVDTVSSQRAKYDSLLYLPGNLQLTAGKKDFALVVKMRGRYFNDERVVYMSGRLNTSQRQVWYYDAYPPAVYRDWWEFYYPIDGATIDRAIDINLNMAGTIYDTDGRILRQRGVVSDGGGAPVSKIQFVVASMRDDLVNRWYGEKLWEKLTLDTLLSFRHHVFDFPRSVQDTASKVYPVFWNNIDPSRWNTGWYLVFFVTEDKYGNRGLAPYNAAMGLDYQRTYNPQHWRFVSGSTGL